MYNNFPKKARNIFKKIEIGKASVANIGFLVQLCDHQPHIVPEVVEGLDIILGKGDMKSRSSAIMAFNKMAQNYLGLADYPVDSIVGCMQKRKKDLHAEDIPRILDILLKMAEKYPERMRTAVPELLMCLENMSAAIREEAYFTLAILAVTHHEFFIGRSKEIIRVLNGLNVDERVYGCKLIRLIAEKEQLTAAETYDVLEELRLNHPDNNLRREAAYTIEKLNEVTRKKTSGVNETEISDGLFDELSDLLAPDEEDLKNMLEGMGLKHLIAGKGITSSWGNPEDDYAMNAMETG